MAAVVLTITPELHLVHDAIDQLARIRHALFKRHGDAFRALQRDIEALDGGSLTLSDPHDLGEGFLVFEPPREIAELIARAKTLGVV